MNEWLTGKLGDMIELKRGYDLPQQSRYRGPIPIVSSSGISDFHSESKVKGPGVVTGRYGTIGDVYFINEDFWPLNTTLYVRDFKGNDPRFISYFLRGIDFFAYSDKAAVPGINRNHLHTAVVCYPADRDEQVAIASVLGALDDKIELNRRINETLEAMARAIFKDWFVDFGPTCAKMEGRAPYLATDIWTLFPGSLDEDAKPEGWASVPLSNLIEVNPSEPLARGKPAPYLDMGALPTAGPNTEAYIHREFGSGMRFRNGDALFARITPCLENGKTAFVQALPEGQVGWGSTEFIVLRARAPVPKPLAYLIARDPAFRANAIRSMTGTSGRQRASSDAVSAYTMTRPSNDDLWTALADVIDPMFERIAANDRESQTLVATRDLLLPKLMSGEIRIKDAEKIAGAAA